MSDSSRVEIQLSHSNKGWRLGICTVWYSNSDALSFASSEDFLSEEAAVKDAKQRAIKCLKEKGRNELEKQVKWNIFKSRACAVCHYHMEPHDHSMNGESLKDSWWCNFCQSMR
jgi:hypothetical protein